MYTKPVGRPGLGAPPVSTLEARPTRVACAALSLILVKTSWNGLSVSRGSWEYNLLRSLHERDSHSWQNLLHPAGYSPVSLPRCHAAVATMFSPPVSLAHSGVGLKAGRWLDRHSPSSVLKLS